MYNMSFILVLIFVKELLPLPRNVLLHSPQPSNVATFPNKNKSIVSPSPILSPTIALLSFGEKKGHTTKACRA